MPTLDRRDETRTAYLRRDRPRYSGWGCGPSPSPEPVPKPGAVVHAKAWDGTSDARLCGSGGHARGARSIRILLLKEVLRRFKEMMICRHFERLVIVEPFIALTMEVLRGADTDNKTSRFAGTFLNQKPSGGLEPPTPSL